MSKEEALIRLLTIEKRLPYGSKARIAQALGHKNRNNVQAAFRGLLGKDLTIMVLQEAKKLAGHGKKSAKMSPAHLHIKKRKKVAAAKNIAA
jgi:hypothetical protein